ncbi:MAG: rRNA methyltransferase [Actinobacteria bacterium HGW-Actinobacteria-4]|nr:MAG: rRNA methyltransferase [Actinobacteria bacterium HGW-Actinobacteria-4]
MTVITIADVDDERLTDYRDLTDVALRTRIEPERGLYIAEGAKVIGRAVVAGHVPRSFLVSPRWLDSLGRPIAAWPDVPVLVGSEDLLEQIAGFNVHRGALAAMHRPVLPSVADVTAGARRIAVLEDVMNHTNVGAVFRSAAAMGIDAVLVSPRCADPLYRRSVRVSMGTVFQVPWTRLESWPAGLGALKEAGFTVAALALGDDAIALDEFEAHPPARLAWLLGTEGDGLSAAAVQAADVSVTIPMARGVDSLNVAAASAVAFWALR